MELCAPSDSVFQTWLEGVDDHRIATCQDGDPPMAYLILFSRGIPDAAAWRR